MLRTTHARDVVLAAAALCLTLPAFGACSTSSGAGGGPADGGLDAASEAAVDGAALLPPAAVTFPKTFLWGSATAAFQVEKGNGNTDWGHWTKLSGKIKNGDQPDLGGPDALNHVDEDVATLTGSGQNAYRFSLEWARVYPTRAAFDADTPDPAAVAAYASLLQKLRAAKITPLVTLVHYSLPDWLDDITQTSSPQGFERAEASDLAATWCGRMAKRFGGDVDWWATLNEPTLPPLTGYVAGRYPPGLFLDTQRAAAYARGEALAHVKCFDAIHAGDTVDADGDGKAALVSLVNQSRAVEPIDPTNPDDVAAADHVRYIANVWFWNVAVKGDWDDDFNGDLTGPNDRRADPALAGRADYVGLNYYSAMGVSARGGVVIPAPFNAVVVLDHLPNARLKTDAFLDIYPDGFRVVIDELAGLKLPFVITENGIADAADANRPRFLAEHIFQVGWAMARGIDVRGYFHWSLMDNFEWDGGFCPKFGFESVDPVTGARTPRASLAYYKGVIAAGRVARSDIDAMPAYSAPRPCN